MSLADPQFPTFPSRRPFFNTLRNLFSLTPDLAMMASSFVFVISIRILRNNYPIWLPPLFGLLKGPDIFALSPGALLDLLFLILTDHAQVLFGRFPALIAEALDFVLGNLKLESECVDLGLKVFERSLEVCDFLRFRWRKPTVRQMLYRLEL
jgi:hypothetical protein